ncbi:MAG: VOC family protein [Pseudomonadota bacterium]
MTTSSVSAVIFANHLRKVAAFYQGVFAIHSSRADRDHDVLVFPGFELTIHQIQQRLLTLESVDSPPERRERSAIRLDFPVTDLEQARREATRLGGVIDDLPPAWAGNDTHFFLGHDPEGNVFGVRVSRRREP